MNIKSTMKQKLSLSIWLFKIIIIKKNLISIESMMKTICRQQLQQQIITQRNCQCQGLETCTWKMDPVADIIYTVLQKSDWNYTNYKGEKKKQVSLSIENLKRRFFCFFFKTRKIPVRNHFISIRSSDEMKFIIQISSKK